MNKIHKYVITISVFSVLFSFSVFAAENAGPSLSIRPSIINLSLSPGSTSTTTLIIKNNGLTPLPLRLRFEPLMISGSSKPLQSIGTWLHISNDTLLLSGQKETSVDIKFILPKKIPLGGYYGMLYVEQLSPEKKSSTSLVLTKIGILILGSVGVQDIPLNSIELQKPITNAFISETNTLSLAFDVKNRALNHVSAKPYLVIHPFRGKPETVQLEERLVFPGTTRSWDTTFTVQDSFKFYYSADLFVSIGNGLSQKQSFSFIIFPIQQSIILVFCIAGGISIVRKRKQIKKAFEILLKG